MIAAFMFHNHSNGPQAWLAFSKTMRHCSVITFDGDAAIHFDLKSYGITARRMKSHMSVQLLDAIKTMPTLTALIVVYVEWRHVNRWRPFWVRSCNELDRYLTGVDVGFTLNPRHFYSKLIRYDRLRNYHIIHAWRRDNGPIRRFKRSRRALQCADGRAASEQQSGAGSQAPQPI